MRNFFITYHHNGNFTSGGFKMAYRFVLDNFPPAQVQPSQEGDDNSKFLLLPAPVQPSMPSLVGCDNGKEN